MSKRSYISAGVLSLAVTASLLLPAVASAHALYGDNDPNRPVAEYVWLGFLHMVAGWDHLLFVAGVVILAGSLRTAAKLVSLFVLGHSITLLTATLAGWQINATVVDVAIALSLVYVGVQGLRGRPDDLRVFGSIVFAFGLVHGLGLSTRLQDLGLPDDGLIVRVVLFNIGVEIGQLLALTVIVGLGTLIARQIADANEWRRVAFVALTAAGVIAAGVLSFPGDEEKTTTAGACSEEATEPEPFGPGAGHPEKTFYRPEEAAPDDDLNHVVGDGFVIIRYRPNLSADGLETIQSLVTSGNQAVIAAPDPEQDDAVRVITAEQTLNCGRMNTRAVTKFRDDWLAQVRQ